jgi:hypothetical protein
MKRKINLVIVILCAAIAALIGVRFGWERGWMGIVAALIIGAVHLFLPADSKNGQMPEYSTAARPVDSAEKTPTELVLLSDENNRIASWNIYGKNGIVIGRDVGENHVTVNLDQAVYASMIDVEHAVLNFSGNDWYVEDVSAQNGVSVQKMDGKKYKLAYGKPCKLERGDIIFIGLTRLQLL